MRCERNGAMPLQRKMLGPGRFRRRWLAFLGLFALPLIACTAPWDPVLGRGPCARGCRAQVVQTFPHDPKAFTQGLFLLDGVLYEGTGLEGQSTLRRTHRATGEIERAVPLPSDEFGEGAAAAQGRIVQLTWKHGRAYVYDPSTLAVIDQLSYPTEGWGLAFDGSRFVMSDGSSTLYFRSPDTFAELGRIRVHDGRGFVDRLNELEVIDGLIYANVWYTDMIVIIDPQDGAVRGRIGLAGLLPADQRTDDTDVLNGIAYDAASRHLLVTGKRWPTLFEIALQEISD